MRLLSFLAAMVCASASAFAQTPGEPTEVNPWDVTAVVASFSGRPPETQGPYDNWFNVGAAAVALGRHLTPHLKVEIDLSATSEGRRWVQRFVTIPGSPSPIPFGAEQFTRTREVSGSLVWQFLENQWAHPFVQIGAAIDADRTRERTFRQQVYIGGSRPENLVVLNEGGETDPTTTTRVRLLLGGGTKVYLNSQVFLRGDARVAIDPAVRSLALRAGFGVDF
jgi:hypothetical protein